MDKNILFDERMHNHNLNTIDAVTYIKGIVDESSWVEKSSFASYDGVYSENTDSVIIGSARIGEKPVEIACFNSKVNQGGFSRACAYKLETAIDNAIKMEVPLISIIDSCGAVVMEGASVLEWYQRIITKINRFRNFAPHVCIIKGGAFGVMAQYTSLADYVIMTKDSIVSFNSPAVTLSVEKKVYDAKKYFSGEIHNTRSGLATFCIEDGQVGEKLAALLSYLPQRVGEMADEVEADIESYNYQIEDAQNLKAGQLVESICDRSSMLELNEGLKCGILTYYARLGGRAVGIYATDRSQNNGLLNKTAIMKLTRFVKNCKKFGLPIVSLIDCDGIEYSSTLEQEELWECIQRLSEEMSYNHPTVSVIVGNSIGINNTLLYTSNACGYTLAWTTAFISPIFASAGGQLKYGDKVESAKSAINTRAEIEKMYKDIDGDAFNAVNCGMINNLIKPCDTRQYVFLALESECNKR